MRVLTLAALFVAGQVGAANYFFEAESFKHESNGWRVAYCRSASSTQALHGASGSRAATATNTFMVSESGSYRIWVRYQHAKAFRGPFDLKVIAGEQTILNATFDDESMTHELDWNCIWQYVDAVLPAGEVALVLAKHESKNCTGYARLVDCILVTDDLSLKPDHRNYGAQTYMRARLGSDYDEPVYIHIFADHYRAPWYSHHYLAKNGAGNGLAPSRTNLLMAGEQTPWCNVSRMLYQDSGAIFNITVRHTYHKRPERMKACFEFASAPDEAAIVRTMDVEAQPNGLVVVMPPNLNTDENIARLRRDLEFAEETGAIADQFAWPAIGRKPERYPFFVSAGIGGYGTAPDQAVIDRERKTLDYFGFSNWTRTKMHSGTWQMLSNSYCRPNMPAITNAAAKRAAELAADGKTYEDVVCCMLMDEPSGQALAFMAGDAAYHEAFRIWLQKEKKLVPADLLVQDWDAVKPVTIEQRNELPALYYYSQRFRTQALGDFMAVQRHALESALGGPVAVIVNFSDGATYRGSFYGLGVDYFELLDDAGQNAIFGEDWANGASSYQCGAYNVDLMRAAARERGQMIGHLLVAHAGRKSLDIKLKAAGNAARGAKMMQSFCYGVYWGSHEGGPAWRSHVWQNKQDVWAAHAELLREIGAVEDVLLPAMPPKAEVAILYSSASDIWTSGENYAYGFDRMHTWLALTHAQVPVDFVSEDQAAADGLKGYRICYYSGPNLMRAAALRLADWVEAGGTLLATAGAGERDEYNRPLPEFASLLPAERGASETFQKHLGSGFYLADLRPMEKIRDIAAGFECDVLSVSQSLTPRATATVLATNSAGEAAWVRGVVGNGVVHILGFLPGLDYIRQALVARRGLVEQAKNEEQASIDGPDSSRDDRVDSVEALSAEDRQRLDVSANPWAFPATTREAILAPARQAGINPPLTCSVPLVDAVYMIAEQGLVVPLANYTLLPLERVELSIRVPHEPKHVESVYHGKLKFSMSKEDGEQRVVFSLPLKSTDYITIRWQASDEGQQASSSSL